MKYLYTALDRRKQGNSSVYIEEDNKLLYEIYTHTSYFYLDFSFYYEDDSDLNYNY